MRKFFIIAAIICSFGLLQANGDSVFKKEAEKLNRLTPKLSFFDVYYQNGVAPSNMGLHLSKVHSVIRMNMGNLILSTTDKPSIFIYKNEKQYIKSSFEVLPWAQATLYPEKSLIITYWRNSLESLKSVLAHELTHLYLEAFFNEEGISPPLWLNEGLAVKNEDAVYKQKERPWYKMLKRAKYDGTIDLVNFFAVRNITGNEFKKIQDYYLTAYSVVEFLLTRHSKLRFNAFCRYLREGLSVDKSLYKVYRYSLKSFKKNWLEWVNKTVKRSVSLEFSKTKTFFEYDGFWSQ